MPGRAVAPRPRRWRARRVTFPDTTAAIVRGDGADTR
jgi:hypothetical protein